LGTLYAEVNRMSHTEHERRLHVLVWITVGLALLALVSGALGGCGSEPAAETPTPTRTPAATATPFPSSTPLPTSTPTPAFTPTPTPLPENVNPLTGEVVPDASVLNRVPVAIKIDNLPGYATRPQAGMNSADIVYEHYNEGWNATRFTAIYLDTDPERVGNVRSGRFIDLEIAAIYKAVIAASGLCPACIPIWQDSDVYPDRIVSDSLPQTENPRPFYRDNNVAIAPYAPFNLFTSPALVRAWAEAHGVSGRQEGLEGMVFSERPTVQGAPATYIYIPFRNIDVEWRYDAASERYLRWSDGVPHTDVLDGRQLNAANVVVLYVPQWDVEDIVEDLENNIVTIQFALWDSNRAVIFRDGVQIDGFWQRWKRWDMLTLTDEQGNPIPLKVGNTFFEVLPADGDHWIEIVVE
jgi:hypothetical protein